jgi:phosphoribosyl 1,2-cyclic phosphodiesterase
LLEGSPFLGSIFLSHLHWDHAQGLPFFGAGDRDDAIVNLYCPAQDGLRGRDLLARMMSPPIFPIYPEGLKGQWQFHALDVGEHTVEGFRLTSFDVGHKGGRTFGYRVDEHGSSVVYIPDHAPAAGRSDGVLSAINQADVLIHDAQFVAAERAMADAYGHATVDDAMDLAVAARVRTLVLFHHGPARTDDQLDAIVAGLNAPPGLVVVAGREGDVMDVQALG